MSKRVMLEAIFKATATNIQRVSVVRTRNCKSVTSGWEIPWTALVPPAMQVIVDINDVRDVAWLMGMGWNPVTKSVVFKDSPVS